MERDKTGSLDPWLSGEKLYGEDFSAEQIAQWFKEESEGYAELGNKDPSNYFYAYHALNRILGFSYLKGVERFEKVLGFGAAWGHEFEPLADRISHLTIIEPSEKMRSTRIGSLKPVYVMPRVDGRLEFADQTFDMVTCFGTLHHIPNVTFVLGELIRVLKSSGTLLLREPIISFGDWTKPRPGLTKNERGIPLACFEKIFSEQPVSIIRMNHCFTLTYQLQLMLKSHLKKPLYSYGLYVRFDRMLSRLLRGNVHYHAVRRLQRIAPSAVFYVVRRT
jgi:SAM-dependent methyltransferase